MPERLGRNEDRAGDATGVRERERERGRGRSGREKAIASRVWMRGRQDWVGVTERSSETRIWKHGICVRGS